MQALMRRELRTALRQKRSFAVLLLITGVSTIVVLWQWNLINQQSTASYWQGINFGGTSVGDMSRQLLDTLTLALVVGCTLFLPGLAASSLTTEKEQDTLDLVRMSLIPPWGIVLGKLVNAVGFYLLIIVGTLPIAGVLFFTAGIDPAQIVYRFAEILSLTFAVAAIGLLCSALVNRTTVALIVTYIAVVITFGGPVLALWIFVSLLQDFAATWAWDFDSGVQRSLFDAIILIEDQLQGLSDYMMPFHADADDWRPIFYRAAVAFNALLLTHVLLRRTPTPKLERETVVIDDAEILDQRRKKFPYYLIDPMKRPKPVPDGTNPMLVKELRWGFLGRMDVLLRMCYGGFIILLLLAAGVLFASIMNSEVFAAIAATTAVFSLVLLITPALLANALTKEREQGNLDMLRMTTLRPGQVLSGKIAAAIVSFAPLLLVTVVVLLLISVFSLLIWNSIDGSLAALRGILTFLMAATLSIVLSLLASLYARSSSTAIVLSYAFTLVFFFGFSMLAYLIITVWRPVDASLTNWWDIRVHQAQNTDIASIFSPVLSYTHPLVTSFYSSIAAWPFAFLIFVPLIVVLYGFAHQRFNRRWRTGD